MAIKMDVRQLKKIKEHLEKLNQVDYDKICEESTNELASRLIRKVVKRTPVLTGHLKGNWRANKAVKRNGQWRTAVYNPTEYAAYVEYGHRTKNGGWVTGRYMLTRSEQELEADSGRIVLKKVEKKLGDVFNGK